MNDHPGLTETKSAKLKQLTGGCVVVGLSALLVLLFAMWRPAVQA